MEREEAVVENTCGCLGHQSLNTVPANQPMKVGSVIRRSFEVGDDRDARRCRHRVDHRLLEVVRMPNFYKKAIKGGLLGFPREGHTGPGHI